MKPTLLLLAAGMGSRYGGLKQLSWCVTADDEVVASGELDLDVAPLSRKVVTTSPSTILKPSFNAGDLP